MSWDLILTLIPVLLGSGLGCLGELKSDLSLKLTQSRTFDFGYVQLTYEIVRSS